MRLVLDTNVVLSAVLWRGTPYRLLQLARQTEDVRLFTSIALLDEFADVLTRQMATRRIAAIGLRPSQVFADYTEIVEIVAPLHVPTVVESDPDDDHVLAAAVAAGADLIVTGDRHLLNIHAYENIQIVTPASALIMLALE